MEAQIAFQAMTTAPRAFTMRELVDVKGGRVDVEKLASDYLLTVITLKSADCPVCTQLLRFLNLYGLDPDMTEYYEPFEGRTWKIQPERKELYKLALSKDAYFIVICPGSEERVAEVQQSVPFMQFPFIGGEQAMRLGRELKLTISDTELWPSILVLSDCNLKTEIIKLGRSPGDLSHRALLAYILGERITMELNALDLLDETRRTIEKLKLKATKCRKGRLVSTLSLLRQPLSPAPTPTPPVQNQGWSALPPEILEHILSFIPETRDIAGVARTSRQFYIAYCNVLIERFREQSTKVRHALPKDPEQMNEPGTDYPHVERRWHNPDGIGFRELERRVSGLLRLLLEPCKDTRPSLRRSMRLQVDLSRPQ